jgi:hypothetical protein
VLFRSTEEELAFLAEYPQKYATDNTLKLVVADREIDTEVVIVIKDNKIYMGEAAYGYVNPADGTLDIGPYDWVEDDPGMKEVSFEELIDFIRQKVQKLTD